MLHNVLWSFCFKRPWLCNLLWALSFRRFHLFLIQLDSQGVPQNHRNWIRRKLVWGNTNSRNYVYSINHAGNIQCGSSNHCTPSSNSCLLYHTFLTTYHYLGHSPSCDRIVSVCCDVAHRFLPSGHSQPLTHWGSLCWQPWTGWNTENEMVPESPVD